MEMRAKDVMDRCPTNADAATVLRRVSVVFDAHVVEIAVLNNEADAADAVDESSSWEVGKDEEEDDGDEWSKSFLAHPYCGATLDDIWCGDSI